MKTRNLMVAFALIFCGVANAQEQAGTHAYAQEFQDIKENPDFKYLFDEEINNVSHDFERKIQNYKIINSKWQRATSFVFLGHDVLVITPQMMPKLYAFIEDLAQKAGIPTPNIFISLHEKMFNAFAAKLLNGTGGILIDLKLLNELTDKQLEATIAHEIGHIKYEHVNKIVALNLPVFFASLIAAHKSMTFFKSLIPSNKVCSFACHYAGYLRYLGMNEYGMGIFQAALMTYIVQSLAIGKKFEKKADLFACQMGHAQGLIEFMNLVENKIKKVDAELIATNDRIVAAQSDLTPTDFVELQQELQGTNMMIRLARWLQAKTPFIPHPSNADRITAAQAYLDAQAALAPEIEKA